MRIHVYIDSCAWNFLFRNSVDLAAELPPEHYELHLTNEIEIELAAIPDVSKDGTDNRDLKRYIATSKLHGKISTTGTFGFQVLEPDGTPAKVQPYVGFGQGTFQSDEERAYYALPEVKAQLLGKRITGSGLSGNQADASLAVHATTAIVLTDESPGNGGPLKLAASKGAKIVYLAAEVAPSGLGLGEYLSVVHNTRISGAGP